ncbi:MAG: DNA polymerase III subunit gamma/tau [Caldilineaceae bacterium]
MSTALYRKWRSQNFDEVIGQEHVTQTLRNALRDNRVAHAYLFSGPRGTGKTSTARILAKALNCTAAEAQRPCGKCPTCVAIAEGRMLDLIEIDAASNNSVDDVRELRDKVGFRPSEGRFKIYIIDEVHMLSTAAFNALLKTLEEPPPHARFILATTEPHKIPATILSRCQRFDFRRIPVSEIAGHLRHIVEEEHFHAEEEALTAIARAAQGCMRDAVSLLDQMFSYGHDTVTFGQVQSVLGAVSAQAVVEFVSALAQRDMARGLVLIQQLMTQGVSLVEFSQQVVEHLRGLMLVQLTGNAALLSDLPGETVRQMQLQAQQMAQPVTIFAIKRFSEAANDLKGGFQPQLPLEMALIEVVQGPAVAIVQNVQVVTPTQAVSTPTITAGAQVPVSPQESTPSAQGEGAEGQSAKPSTAAVSQTLDANAVRKLQASWGEIKNTAKAQLGLQAVAALNSVRNMAIGEQTVALAFGNNQFSHDIIAKPEMLGKVAAIIAKVVGRPVQLECQMGDSAKLPNMIKIENERKRDGADPLLEYAVSTLGAQVVEKA